ncbi:MAG: DUF72 domain-containing protein [Planctomycetes bacterium]|nr:DUF72 domain-containing protein [Planctomycetota bacterium]
MNRLLIGPAGWSYDDWKGIVYPNPAPRGWDPLVTIAQHFDCVELNNTFYRPPTARMSETWARKTPDDFIFTAKLWEKFTHDKQGFTQDDVRLFRTGLEPLAASGKLAALLMQFPWFFQDAPSSRDRIRKIADAFQGRAPLVIELRHRSWLDALDFLREHRLSFCNIDQPQSAGAITGTDAVTGPLGYVRFHGRNAKAWFSKDAGRDEKYDYLYSIDELKGWANKIAAMKADRVFVILNNHFRGKGVVNALQLKRLLGQEILVPEPLREAYPGAFE